MNARGIYQKYLKDEFERRKYRNISYSWRAYARDIGVPSSKLSQYLNGACGLSAQKATLIAKNLRLSPIEIELFICSAEASHARSAASREAALVSLKRILRGSFTQINMERFNLIRDWYHFAILELLEVKDFQPDIRWISKALGVPPTKIQTAVQRLEKLGLLVKKEKSWVQTNKDFETPPDFLSRGIREYHSQMLDLVSQRFEEVPLEDRELGSVVFAVSRSLIPEYKNLVREFQKKAAALAERESTKDSLYALNFQLMPIYLRKSE